jgi:amino acid permease
MGFMLLLTMQALGMFSIHQVYIIDTTGTDMNKKGEIAIMYPVSGGFYTLTGRFIDQSWAFSMGWIYLLQWAVTLPVELVSLWKHVIYSQTPTNI